MSIFFTVAILHFFAVVSPGPDFVLISRQCLRYGRKVALWIAKNFENVDLLIYYNLLANEAKEIDVEIDDEDNGQGFAEISFENKFEMINFLENSQYLEDEIKNLIFSRLK